MHRLDIRDQRADRSGQRQRRVDHVRRQVAHRPVRAARRAPGGGRRGIGEEVLAVLAAEIGDVSDLARRDDLAGKLRRRRPDVVETGHVDDAAPLRGLDHGPAVFEAAAQGLLAEHRLSQRDGRERDLPVGLLRRGEDHRLDLGILDEPPPVRGRPLEAEEPRLARRALFGGRADHLEPRSQRGPEHGGDGLHGDRMGLAHVAAADNPQADPPRFHDGSRSSFATACNTDQLDLASAVKGHSSWPARNVGLREEEHDCSRKMPPPHNGPGAGPPSGRTVYRNRRPAPSPLCGRLRNLRARQRHLPRRGAL